MSHPNEDRLRDLYTAFATQRDLTQLTFTEWITGVLGQTGGRFQEHVLDVFANDEHGILTLHHEFNRDRSHREYLTAHAVQFEDRRICAWEERPGCMAEFEAAWESADALLVRAIHGTKSAIVRARP
jgi:hypothetical protein